MTLEDDLAPESSRFPLSVAFDQLPFSDDRPSGHDTRPYALRVAGVPAPTLPSWMPPARYCAASQVSVTDDEHRQPIFELGYDRTTIGSKDGQDPAQEDWKPDI